MQLFKVGGTRRRWIVGGLWVIALGLVAVTLLPPRRNLSAISVTILKASPGLNGGSDLELEIVNESGGEVLIPAYQLPGEGPELWMSESAHPLDAGRRRLMEVWIDGVQSSLQTAGDQPLSVTRCQPIDLVTCWGTHIRLPPSGPRRSLHARLHLLSPESVVGIAYVPLRKPGPAPIWIRYQLARRKTRTPVWFTGSRAQFLELHPPLIMAESTTAVPKSRARRCRLAQISAIVTCRLSGHPTDSWHLLRNTASRSVRSGRQVRLPILPFTDRETAQRHGPEGAKSSAPAG